MPSLTPVPTKNPGDVLTSSLWNSYLRDNINKLLDRGHRVLTVAQFAALVSPEGTKGTVAPDEVYLEVDATNGVLWHLEYESGETTFKWRFIGGPAMFSEVTTSETTLSTTFAALTTAGPSVALPRAGDYDVMIGFCSDTNAVTAGVGRMSYDIGGTGAVDADSARAQFQGGSLPHSVARPRRKAGLTTVTLTSKYRVTAGTQGFADRWMNVRPVRIRHDA